MKVQKIDIHNHVVLEKGTPRFYSAKLGDWLTPEETFRFFDLQGIEKGVQLPFVSPEWGTHTMTNEEAMELVRRYPDRFEWFCNIDPRNIINDPSADFTPMLEYYKSMGAKGVGEMTANLYFDDPLVWNLFSHCEKCEMPVLFHVGNLGLDYGLVDELGLPRLEKSLKQFPNLIFIGHSQKYWAEISGDCDAETRDGYPTGKVTPGGRVVELMRKYPNLHSDLSAGSGGNAIMRDPEFGYAFLEEFCDRLYFGTDICHPDQIEDDFKLSFFLDDAVESGKISQNAYNKICRENALKLLNR